MWVKQLRSDLSYIVPLPGGNRGAYDIIKSYTADPRSRMKTATSDNPAKCGIWLVWGFEEEED